MILRNLINKSDFGLVINYKFHTSGKWVSALTYYLVEEVINEFNPIIITSQHEYNRYKKRIKKILSMEPGWAAPKINYDVDLNQKKAVMASDPHNKVEWFRQYFLNNNFDSVFSYYKSPFFYHFPDFPAEKFIHMPWAFPNKQILLSRIDLRNNDVVIFGAGKSDAYDIRNWCRSHKEIKSFDNSGVENKKMTDMEYFEWLRCFDAAVAAGSSDPKYDLVTPKYFEIPASGTLLFGQKCKDLKDLGFEDRANYISFNKFDIIEKIREYKNSPKKYMEIRRNGLEFIRDNHLISHRINKIKEVLL